MHASFVNKDDLIDLLAAESYSPQLLAVSRKTSGYTRLQSFLAEPPRLGVTGTIERYYVDPKYPGAIPYMTTKQVSDILDGIERDAGIPVGQTRMIPWLENSRAVVRAYEIASASPRILGVTFGAEDFTDDMGVKRTDEGSELAYPRAAVAVAARAAGVLAFDTPQVNFRDIQALERDIHTVVALGFKGKFAIHPGQLDTINTLFSPSQEEVAYARRVIEVFQEAEAKGSGATSLDGKLIDVPVVKRARALIQIADALSLKQW